MRKAIIALLAGGALAAAAAAPAFAQSYDPSLSQREDGIRERINDAQSDGDLTAGQASRLRAELRQITDLDVRYQDEGMADWQIRDLNSRLSLLGSRLNYDLTVTRDEYDKY
jgi:hypothetical protein